MKKEYQQPVAEYVSLAAAEKIATDASYYANEPGLGGGVWEGSLPSDW